MKIRLPRLHLRVEKWKYNEKYEVWVSSEGHIERENGEPCRVRVNSGGYLSVKIPSNRFVTIHKLVLETFHPIENCDNMTIDHLNHNKRDNSIRNLEWVTFEENQRRALNDKEPTISPKKEKPAIVSNPIDINGIIVNALVQDFFKQYKLRNVTTGMVYDSPESFVKWAKNNKINSIDNIKLFKEWRQSYKKYFGDAWVREVKYCVK